MSRKVRSHTLPGLSPSTSSLSMQVSFHGERLELSSSINLLRNQASAHRPCLRDSSSYLELVPPQTIYDSENEEQHALPEQTASMMSMRGRRYSESAVSNPKLRRALKRLQIFCKHFNVDDYRPKETRLKRFQRLQSIAEATSDSEPPRLRVEDPRDAKTKSPKRSTKKKRPTPTPPSSPSPTPTPSSSPSPTPSPSPSPPPPEPPVPRYDFDQTMEIFNLGIEERRPPTENVSSNNFFFYSRFPECASFDPCHQDGILFCRLFPSVGIISMAPGSFRERHGTDHYNLNFITITGTVHFEVVCGNMKRVHRFILSPFSFLRLGPNCRYSMHNMGEVQAAMMFLRMTQHIPTSD